MFFGGEGGSKYVPMVGTTVPKYQREASKDFLRSYMRLNLERRVITEVKINPVNIQSGDVLLIRRFDGVQPFFMALSGSNVGHAAVAMRDSNNTLWVMET